MREHEDDERVDREGDDYLDEAAHQSLDALEGCFNTCLLITLGIIVAFFITVVLLSIAVN